MNRLKVLVHLMLCSLWLAQLEGLHNGLKGHQEHQAEVLCLWAYWMSVRDAAVAPQGVETQQKFWHLAQCNIFTGSQFMHIKKKHTHTQKNSALILHRARPTNGQANSLAWRGIHT